MRILVVNAGSSSLKLSVLDADDRLITSADIAAPGAVVDEEPIRETIERCLPIDAVGHRVVHGGSEFVGPARLTTAVMHQLWSLADLAPLHQPKSLSGIETVNRVLPDVPAVACFDTAFHAGMPAAATTYALPKQWRVRWDLRRFGFHGLSHSWASRRAAAMIGRPVEALRTVTCHLGAGASLCAVDRGRSVDTTMGFTPLEGLVMATRSGSVDPGLILWLEEHAGIPPSDLADTLEHRCGLLALTGSADMPTILGDAARGEPDSLLAIAVYVQRLRSGIAAMTASLAGLDALVFTGGVGQNAPVIRARAVEGLRFAGVELDAAANEAAVPDADIGASGAAVRCLVVESREDLEIARQVRSVLAEG